MKDLHRTTSVRMPKAMADLIQVEGAKLGRLFSEQARHYIALGMAAEGTSMETLQANLAALNPQGETDAARRPQ